MSRQESGDLDELRDAARALGVADADQMDRGQLEHAVKTAQSDSITEQRGDPEAAD